MKSIVALDIATTTGVAYDAPGGLRPLSSTWRAPPADPDDLGTMGVAFQDWLVEVLSVIKPDMLAIEAPLVPRGNNLVTSARTVQILIGLAFLAETTGKRAGVEVVQENVGKIKKHFTGDGRARKGGMIAAARLMGWEPRNDHEADAMALWAFCKATDDPAWAPNGTPLFAGAEIEGNDRAAASGDRRAAR